MTLLLLVASVLAAIGPMFTFLAIVWWLDRYDREPVWLLVLTFAWGAVPAVLMALPGSALLGERSRRPGRSVRPSTRRSPRVSPAPCWSLPSSRSPPRRFILLYLIFSRHFDNMTDGFVYGAAAGLGFGMSENLLYFFAASDSPAAWGATVLIRTFYSAVMHATATSVLRGSPWLRALPILLRARCSSGVIGYVLAVGVHMLWNGLIVSAEVIDEPDIFLANLALCSLSSSVWSSSSSRSACSPNPPRSRGNSPKRRGWERYRKPTHGAWRAGGPGCSAVGCLGASTPRRMFV